MFKNTAGQKWRVFAFDISDGSATTGNSTSITAKIAKDWAAAAGVTDVNPTEVEDGYYLFDLTQAETNADVLDFYPDSASTGIQVIGVPGTLYTLPPNFSDLGLSTGGAVSNVTTNADMRGTDSALTAANASTAVRTAVGLAAANLDTQIATLTTGTMRGTDSALTAANASTAVRTAVGLAAANLDTQIATLTTGTMRGTDSAATAANLQLAMGGSTSFSSATDSLEAIRNRGDAAWVSATVISTGDLAAAHAAYGALKPAVAGRTIGLSTASEVLTVVTNTDMRGTDSALTAANASTAVRTAVGLAAANLDTQIATLTTGAMRGTDSAATAANLQLAMGGSTSFSSATDSLEAIRNRGDAAWISSTAGGFLSTGDLAAAHAAYGALKPAVAGRTIGLSTASEVLTVVTNTDMRGTDSAATAANLQLAMGGSTSFSSATDSLEAIRNRGDAAWLSSTGGAALSTGDLGAALDAYGALKPAVAGRTIGLSTASAVLTVVTNTDMRGTDGASTGTMRGTDGANTATPLTAGGVRTAVGMASANLDTQINTLTTGTMRGTDSAFLAASAPTNFGSLGISTGGAVSNVTSNADMRGTDSALTAANASTAVRTAVGLAAANLDTQIATLTTGTMRGTDSALTAANASTAVRTAVGLAAANLDTQIATLTTGTMRGTDSANTTTPLTAAGVRTAVGLAAANLDTQINTLTTGAMRGTDGAATAAVVSTGRMEKLDSLTFTKAGEVDANLQSIDGTALQGVGSTANAWRPV